MGRNLRPLLLGVVAGLVAASAANAQFETRPGGGPGATGRVLSGGQGFDSDGSINDQRAEQGLSAVVAAPGAAGSVTSASSQFRRRQAPKAGGGELVTAKPKDCVQAEPATGSKTAKTPCEPDKGRP